MIAELSYIALLAALPEHGLRRGDVGTVVFAYPGGAAFEVEFLTPEGETIDVVTLEAGQVRAVSKARARRATLRKMIDDTSAELGPRLRAEQLMERYEIPIESRARWTNSLRRLRVVDRRSLLKVPRLLEVMDPPGSPYLLDLKSLRPARRRAFLSLWGHLREAVRDDPLGTQIPEYQRRLRALLDTPSEVSRPPHEPHRRPLRPPQGG